jgi:propanol-preferring alcohol dehydrogenase
MRAMVLHQQSLIEKKPLHLEEVEIPSPKERQVLVKVLACGVCRTDLHIIEGDLKPKKLPLIPGHQVVGIVEKCGPKCTQFNIGDKIGIAWLRYTCKKCKFCKSNKENLCQSSLYTGYDAHGGYAEYTTVDEEYAYLLPKKLDPVATAPLLCAGIIGYHALKQSGIQKKGILGIYGFGTSAHLTIQVAKYWGCTVFVATKSSNHQQLAKEMGADCVGPINVLFPAKTDANLVFAPVGEVIPWALRSLNSGGTASIAGISMTNIPELNYEQMLFHEKKLVSTESNTRKDGKEFLELAEKIPIKAHTTTYPLEKANEALGALKAHKLQGAAVLKVSSE